MGPHADHGRHREETGRAARPGRGALPGPAAGRAAARLRQSRHHRLGIQKGADDRDLGLPTIPGAARKPRPSWPGCAFENRKGFHLKKPFAAGAAPPDNELYRNREAITFKAVARAVKDMAGEGLFLLLLDFADRRSREPEPLRLHRTGRDRPLVQPQNTGSASRPSSH